MDLWDLPTLEEEERMDMARELGTHKTHRVFAPKRVHVPPGYFGSRGAEDGDDDDYPF